MKPSRPIFGLDKISETVHVYNRCLDQFIAGDETVKTSLAWSKDILVLYFRRVSKHPIVDAAKPLFDKANIKAELDMSISRVPYTRLVGIDLPTVDQIENLAKFRRSVRWFLDKPVPREALDRALRIAMEAPSACNRQAFRWELFDKKELVQIVGSVPKGASGWLHQIPVFAVLIGKFDAFRFERDRHVPYIDGALSAMNLINGLEVQGISSCCVNFPDFSDTENRMAQVLNLKPWERAIMCLAIGYPDMTEKVAYSQKIPLDMVRTYNGQLNDIDQMHISPNSQSLRP